MINREVGRIRQAMNDCHNFRNAFGSAETQREEEGVASD